MKRKPHRKLTMPAGEAERLARVLAEIQNKPET